MKRNKLLILMLLFFLSFGAVQFIYGDSSSSDVSRTQLESNKSGSGADMIGVYDWVTSKLGDFFRGKYVVKQSSADQGNSGTPGTLAYIINQVGSNKVTITLTGPYTYTLSTNLIIPDNIKLQFDKGAEITGTGSLTGLHYARPAWFKLDGVNDQNAINAASAAVGVNGTVEFKSGYTYIVSDTAVLKYARQRWFSRGTAIIKAGTTLKGKAVVSLSEYDKTSSIVDEAMPFQMEIENIKIDGGNKADYGLEIKTTKKATVKNIEVINVLKTPYFLHPVCTTNGWDLSFLQMTNCSAFSYLQYGMYIDLDTRSMTDCSIENLTLTSGQSTDVAYPGIYVSTNGTATGAQGFYGNHFKNIFIAGHTVAIKFNCINNIDASATANDFIDCLSEHSNSGNGYHLDLEADGTALIRGNTFINQKTQLASGNGIKLIYADDNNIGFNARDAVGSTSILVNADVNSNHNKINLFMPPSGTAYYRNSSGASNFISSVAIQDAGNNIYTGAYVNSNVKPLLPNGNFEQAVKDIPVGWEKMGGTASTKDLLNTSTVKFGQTSVALSTSDIIKSKILNDINEYVTVSCWVNSAATTAAQIGVAIVDNSGVLSESYYDGFIHAGNWVLVMTSFKPTAPYWIELTNGSSSPAYFDGLCVNKGEWVIPPPTVAPPVSAYSSTYTMDKYAQTTSTSGTTETTLRTITLPADMLDGFFGGVKITAFGTITGSNSTKTIKAYCGSTSLTLLNAINTTESWKATFIVQEKFSNIQQLNGTLEYNGENPVVVTGTSSEPTSGPITIKLTGQCANSGDTISMTGWIVEKF